MNDKVALYDNVHECEHCGHRIAFAFRDGNPFMTTSDGIMMVKILWYCPKCEGENALEDRIWGYAPAGVFEWSTEDFKNIADTFLKDAT